MTQIDEALCELKKKNGGFKTPKVTIIVAQRQSNYRIVPQNVNPQARPMEQVRLVHCILRAKGTSV